jgi:hypothetical protein
MSLKLFPDDIINHYNLREKALDGYVYTWRFDAACTVYHKLASWQINSYANAWDDMATSKYNTRPVFGSMSPTPSGLICAWTTLVSNILATKNLSTSILCYALKYMTLLRIGLAISTVASI